MAIRMVGLRIVRKKRNLNQKKVALDLNMTREALSHYENGKREPGNAMLVHMSEYFGVSIYYLITGRERIPGENKAIRFYDEKKDEQHE